jgi:NADH-quinone oxidoreductase subunit A
MIAPINFFTMTALLFLLTAPINILLLYLTIFLAPKIPSKDKNETFECGFSAFSDTRNAFNVQYYLTAVLFLIFDVELALLIPWAPLAFTLGTFPTIIILIFMGCLGLTVYLERTIVHSSNIIT